MNFGMKYCHPSCDGFQKNCFVSHNNFSFFILLNPKLGLDTSVGFIVRVNFSD